jgi:hypothetical protein
MNLNDDVYIDDCLMCIDGLCPAGTDPVLGPVYQACHACGIPCLDCQGSALFPGHYEFFALLADSLWALGFDINHCRECLGILEVTAGGDQS